MTTDLVALAALEHGLVIERHDVDYASAWWMVHGRGVDLSVETRPHYCDRGRFIVKAFPTAANCTIDSQDGFPRYYFDAGRMMAEVRDFLACRRLLP